MINKKETFTFTFLFNDEEDKVILITHGEEPAKEISEADSVLTYKNEDEREAIDKIISKIDVFKEAEPGSEESISATLEELEDRYDISLEDMEEETGEDLDDDTSQEKSEDSEKDNLDNLEHSVEDIDDIEGSAIVAIHMISDPMASLPIPADVRTHMTSPIAFLDEEDEEEIEEIYEPFSAHTLSRDTEELEEGAGRTEVITKIVTAAKTKADDKGILNIPELTTLFTSLGIVDKDSKLTILRMLLQQGNLAKVFTTPTTPALPGHALEVAGEPFLVIGPASIPMGATEIPSVDNRAISQAISKMSGF